MEYVDKFSIFLSNPFSFSKNGGKNSLAAPIWLKIRRMYHFYRSLHRYIRDLIRYRKFPDWQRLKVKDNPIERKMYDELTRRGYKVKTLYRYYDYEIDLVIRKPVLIAIELDGKVHEQEEVMKRDRQKTARLKKAGFIVLRFKSKDVFRRVGWCADQVDKTIHTYKKDLFHPLSQLYQWMQKIRR